MLYTKKKKKKFPLNDRQKKFGFLCLVSAFELFIENNAYFKI